MTEKNLFFNLADKFTKIVYIKTLEFPYKYQSSLGDQLRRSSLSVVLNIVEGGARISIKEKRQFLNITFGSLKETKYLLFFSKECGVISESWFDTVIIDIDRLASLIYGYLYKK